MQTKLQKQYIAGSMPNFISNIKRVLDQFSIFVSPDNVRKENLWFSDFFRGYRNETLS